MKKLIIVNEILKCESLILIGDRKECNKYLVKIKNKHLIGEEEVLGGQLIKNNYGCYRHVWLEKFNKKSKEDIGFLIHELFHLVIRICEDKGIPNVPNIQTGHCGDETGAYLIEFYFNKIINKC